MSARKRWKTESWPGCYQRSHTSMKKAYEYVVEQRENRRLNLTRTQSINVKVNEGLGWLLYETVRFPITGQDPSAEPVKDR